MTLTVQVLKYFLWGLMVGLVISLLMGHMTGTLSVFPTIQETSRSGSHGRFQYGGPHSHEELDRYPSPDKPVDLGARDAQRHKDDRAVADALYNKVRVLCWVMTSQENLPKKAVHVKATWGPRCNKLLFVSDNEDRSFPTVAIEVPHGRDHLTAKTMKAFDYVYRKHAEDADWFLKADDDTYVIVENLRYMLSAHEPTDPLYMGHHFKVLVKQGYMSGGAGYVVSKEALRKFFERPENLCSSDKGAEDVEFGICMERLGVQAVDSRDNLGRTRFHCFNPGIHLHGSYPDWYYNYSKYEAQRGIANMSDYPVTFHYISPNEMYDLEYYTYHMRPYGVKNWDQDLNPLKDTTLSSEG